MAAPISDVTPTGGDEGLAVGTENLVRPLLGPRRSSSLLIKEATRQLKARTQSMTMEYNSLLLVPFYLAVALSAVVMASGITFSSPSLRAPAPIADVFNFWGPLLFGLSPILVTAYLYIAICLQIHQIISTDATGGDINSLARAAERVSVSELVSWLAYNTYAGMAVASLVKNRFISIGFRALLLPETVVAVGFPIFIVSLNLAICVLARQFRIMVIRRCMLLESEPSHLKLTHNKSLLTELPILVRQMAHVPSSTSQRSTPSCCSRWSSRCSAAAW
jgi:hypothetical protein